MAKKVKTSKIETIDKIMETLNIWAVPVSATIALWWGFDVSVDVLAVVGAINGVLDCVKRFIKK